MSSAAAKTPKAATVEDWDDDSQTALPDTRTTANVAVKRSQSSGSVASDNTPEYKNDGTDSGYSSKAPTVTSASSPSNNTSDIKADTAVVLERERRQYARTSTRIESDRQLPVRPKEEKKEVKDEKPVKKPFCHQKGICWVCDKFGQHLDAATIEKIKKEAIERAKAAKAAPQQPTSPKLVRNPAPKAQAEEQQVVPARPTVSRRMSSAARPPSMYMAPPVQPPYQQPPPIQTSMPPPMQPPMQPMQPPMQPPMQSPVQPMQPNWHPPTHAPTPPPQNVHPNVQYAQYFMPPGTPVSGMPNGYFVPATPVYYEQPVFHEEPVRPSSSRRMSMAQPPQERPLMQEQIPRKPSRKLSTAQHQHEVLMHQEEVQRKASRRMSVAQQQHEKPVYQEEAVKKSSRRTSVSQHQVERPVLDRRMSRSAAQRPVLQEKRPSVVPNKTVKHADVDRKIDDKIKMPPPPRPQHANVMPPTAARPQMPRRSSTYQSEHVAHARKISQTYDYETSSSSSSDDDSDYEARPSQIHPSPARRPPSSYRTQTPVEAPVIERPTLPVKSASYADGSRTTQVAASHAKPIPRRTTTGSVPLEDRHAPVDAHHKKKSSVSPNDLTAENLRKVISRNNDHKSDAGSTASHQTHHSSSKGSSAGQVRANGQRSERTNININDISLSIPSGYHNDGSSTPVTIDLGGGIQISMNGKENFDARRPMKQIERAPSAASNPSRRSLTNGGQISGSHLRHEDHEVLAIEAPRENSRRPSYVDEHDREVVRSTKSSRQASRVGSKRPSMDTMRRDTLTSRNSIEYVRRDDAAIYGA